MLTSSPSEPLTASHDAGSSEQLQRELQRARSGRDIVDQGHRQVAANLEQVIEMSLQQCGRTWICLFIVLICGMFVVLIWSQTVYERHKMDPCDQPLALMLRLLYIIVPIHTFKRELIQCVLCYDSSEPMEPCRVKVFKFILTAVTLLWPVAAEIMALTAGTCSEQLVNVVQAIVAYYAAIAIIGLVLPACYVACMMYLVRRGLVRLPPSTNRAPENFVERLPKVQFSADLFNDSGDPGTFPSQCSICLDEVDANKSITKTLCQPCPHAFHTECLEGWLGCSQTCPLCRTNLVEAAGQPEV